MIKPLLFLSGSMLFGNMLDLAFARQYNISCLRHQVFTSSVTSPGVLVPLQLRQLRWWLCLMASRNVIFGVNSWHRFMSAKRFFFLVGSQEGRGSRECCGVDRSR